MKRTIQQIEAELKTASTQYRNWQTVQNEGATDGYNPHEAKINELADELYEAKQAEIEKILSGDSLKAEREAFNGQGFKSDNVAAANEWCESRGYSLSDLMSASKKAREAGK